MTNRGKQQIVESLMVKAAKMSEALEKEIDPSSFTRGSSAEINAKGALVSLQEVRFELGDLAAAIERGDV